MRIDSLGRPTGATTSARPAARSRAFSLDDAPKTARSGEAQALRSAPALDALMALQAYEEELPRERRRKALARGRGLLDVLDGLKIALVEGRDDPAALRTLVAQLSERRAATGDAGLDDALSAIELRAQVEMAKRGA